jgi:hypothetical protein
MAVVAKMVTCVGDITAPPNSMGSADKSVGYDLGLGFQMIMAKVCSKMLIPMAVIRGAKRGELRNGL